MKKLYIKLLHRALFISFGCFFGGINLTAQSYTLTNEDVKIDENGIITSCSYQFEIKDIVIPEIIDGKAVKGIIDKGWFVGVFWKKGITKITFPNSMETVGDYAFYGNAIEILDFSSCPNLNRIGKSAFQNNLLENVNFNECINLTSIGESAFSNNILLTINLDNCNSLENIGMHAFSTNSLTELNLSSCKSLINIETNAFYSNKLTSLDLSSCTALTSIGQSAFARNLLTSLKLQHNEALITIGNYAFSSNSLSKLDLSSCVNLTTIGDNAFQNNSLVNINLSSCSKLTSIGHWAFSRNNLTSLDLSLCSNLSVISRYAFRDNSLESITFPISGSLKIIDNSAFDNNSLSNLDFSACSKLASIGSNAFNNNSLTSINFHGCNNLTSIDEHAFDNNLIANIDLNECKNIRTIGAYAFDNNKLTKITLPPVDYSNYIVWSDSNNKRYMVNEETTNFNLSYEVIACYVLTDDDVVVDNSGIIQSCSYNFENTDIVIPDILDNQVVKGIADADSELNGIFFNKGITSLVIPKNIELIGDFAFGENVIPHLDFGSFTHLKKVGERAFINNLITEVDLSNSSSLSTIGIYSFALNKISSLTFGELPELFIIQKVAFYYNKIKTLNFSGCSNLQTIEYGAFDNNTGLGSIIFGPNSSLKTIESMAFADSRASEIDLSGCSKLETIGSNAFSGNSCNSIIDLTNCISLKLIEDLAFYGNYIKGIILPTPVFSNATFNHWDVDRFGSTQIDVMQGGSTTKYFRSIYTANITLNLYDVNFIITDGFTPIAGASVTLSGYGTKTSDVTGKVSFSHVKPQANLDYTITMTNYNNATGCVSVLDDAISEEIVLGLTTGISNQKQVGMTLYPNPTKKRVFFTNDFHCEINRIIIRNITGNIVDSMTFDFDEQISFDIIGGNGIYFVEIYEKNQLVSVIKVVKKS